MTPCHYGAKPDKEHYRVCEDQEKKDGDSLFLPVAFLRGRTLRARRFRRKQRVCASAHGQLGTPGFAVGMKQGFVRELGYRTVTTRLRLRH